MRSVTPYERLGEPSPDTDAHLDQFTFREGDTLSLLAHRFYEDWRLWRVIADRNSIVDVRQIEPGIVLLIPPRPLERGAFEST